MHKMMKKEFIDFTCKKCDSKERPHKAHGKCIRCYQAEYFANHRAKYKLSSDTQPPGLTKETDDTTIES